jgi:hypothetical protein
MSPSLETVHTKDSVCPDKCQGRRASWLDVVSWGRSPTSLGRTRVAWGSGDCPSDLPSPFCVKPATVMASACATLPGGRTRWSEARRRRQASRTRHRPPAAHRPRNPRSDQAGDPPGGRTVGTRSSWLRPRDAARPGRPWRYQTAAQSIGLTKQTRRADSQAGEINSPA